MGALDTFADIVLGPEGEGGGVVDTLTGAINRGVNLAVGFGGLGEGLDFVAGVTGLDPLTGENVPVWQRGLSLAALAGLGAVAVDALSGRGPGHLALAMRSANFRQRRLTDLERLAPELGGIQIHQAVARADEGGRRPGRPIVPVSTPANEMEALNQELPHQDLIWGTLTRTTNRLLGIDDDIRTGYDQIADILGDLHPKAKWDEDQYLTAAAVAQHLGQRYLREVPAHTASLGNFNDPESAALAVASYEIARWQWLYENRRLRGNRAEEVRKLWDKFLKGERLNDAEAKFLDDAMVDTAVAISPFPHPELVTDPFTRLFVNLDDGARAEFDVLQFDARRLEDMTAKEVDRRISLMFQTHPGALITPMVDNIVRFYEDFVTDHILTKFRKWYPKERVKLEEAAAKYGFDPRTLTAAASILSGAEEWEGNIEKAVVVLRAIRDTKQGRGAVKKIQNRISRQGWKASQDDIVRVLLLTAAEDPMQFFNRGKSKGLKLSTIGQRWERGEALEDLIDLRKKEPDYKSQKQPSFLYGLWESHEEELAEQTRALYLLMSGEMGADTLLRKASNIPFSEVRRSIPLVVDRQAFKIALGFSLVPGTWLSGQKGAYDAIAQAYRIAAARIGKVNGEQLLPEELQAVTWMQWRALTNVTDPMGEKWPKGTRRPQVQRPGMVRPIGSIAGWTDGAGPDFVFSNNILDLILRGRPEVFPVSGIDANTDFSTITNTINELNQTVEKTRPEKFWYRFGVSQTDDGRFLITSPDDVELPQDVLRTHWGTRARINGRQVWVPKEPMRVRDARAELDRWVRDTFLAADPSLPGTTGASIYPDGAADIWRRQGLFLRINAPEFEPQAGLEAHRQFLAELERRGVRIKDHGIDRGINTGYSFPGVTETPDGGKQYVWTADAAGLTEAEFRNLPTEEYPQPQRAMWVEFASVEDMHLASQVLREVAEDVYKEQILDAVYYVNGPSEAPPNTRRVFEHHAVDDVGKEVVNLNVSGDPIWAHSVPVYVHDDFYGFLEPFRTRTHEPGGFGAHTFAQREPLGWTFDGQIDVVPPPPELGIDVKPPRRPGNLMDVKVNGKQAPLAGIAFGGEGLPLIAYGRTEADLEAQLGFLDDVVIVRRGTGGKFFLEVPAPDGRASGVFVSQVEQLLHRGGIRKISIRGRG